MKGTLKYGLLEDEIVNPLKEAIELYHIKSPSSHWCRVGIEVHPNAPDTICVSTTITLYLKGWQGSTPDVYVVEVLENPIWQLLVYCLSHGANEARMRITISSLNLSVEIAKEVLLTLPDNGLL